MKSTLLLGLVLFLALPLAKSSELLINEMEDLMRSLEYKDPGKPKMLLRLADLYFDEAKKIEKSILLENTGDPKKLKKYRDRAIELYRSALSGDKGVYPKLSGAAEIKVNFQIGRLFHRMQLNKKALPYYQKAVETSLPLRTIVRESALSLADIYENDNKFQKAFSSYKKALQLCGGAGEVCSYINYRLAWLLYRENKIEDAISTIKKTLFDDKGQIKERSLKDYLVFVSNRTTDGKKEISEIEKLSKKISRPELLETLMYAFYSAGNRTAGVEFMQYLNRRSSNSYYQIRLLEEYYGFKKFEEFSSMMEDVVQLKPAQLPTEKKKSDEVAKIFKRLIVQLDAERESNSAVRGDLRKLILFYLKIYPKSELRNKMQEGWMAIVDDPNEKINQLGIWLEDPIDSSNKQKVLRYQKIRYNLAQKTKNESLLLEQAKILSEIEPKKKRFYLYTIAYTHYKNKNYANAVPLFEQLQNSGKSIDEYSLKSVNLLMDVYNTQKEYSKIMKTSSTWLANAAFVGNPKFKKDVVDMQKIETQSRFEYAVSLKESPEALKIFSEYCNKNIFAKKSCVNAKVLSVKLGDQKQLVSILKKTGDEKSLLAEYELMGEFSKAARLYEKNKFKSTQQYLKVALLYELAFENDQRDRILKKMIQFIKRKKKIETSLEPLIYKTLRDTNLLSAASVTLPWTQDTRLKIVREMENTGRGNKTTRKILMKSKVSMGPVWSRRLVSQIEKLDKAQQKIKFYGRGSKWKFNKRIKKLNSLKSSVDRSLEGADYPSRIILLRIVEKAYAALAKEINETPLPEGLEPEQIASVKQSLAQMASPFQEESVKYLNLKSQQIALYEKESGQKVLMKLEELEQSTENFAGLILDEKFPEVVQMGEMDWIKIRPAVEQLKKTPGDIETLGKIRDFYSEQNMQRQAAYFKERIEMASQTKTGSAK